MLTASELQKIGEEVAGEFITNGTPLTKGLTKIAGEHGLNKQQISRVAEVANTSTYLKMIKTAKDKYVEFPLADPTAIYATIKESISKTASGNDTDYNSSPSSDKEWPVFKLFKVAVSDPQEEINKEAAAKRQLKREAGALQSKIEFTTNHLQEKLAEFEKDYEELFFLTKQAVLQNIPFSHLETIIKIAGELISDTVLTDYRARLTRIAPHIALDDEKVAGLNESGAPINLVPNKTSAIYKLANSLQDQILHITRVNDALDTMTDNLNACSGSHFPNLEKYAIKVVRPIIGGAIEAVRLHPKRAGMVAIVLVANNEGKKKGKYKQGVILQKSVLRKRLGA